MINMIDKNLKIITHKIETNCNDIKDLLIQYNLTNDCNLFILNEIKIKINKNKKLINKLIEIQKK
jgi:hypothetical protein